MLRNRAHAQSSRRVQTCADGCRDCTILWVAKGDALARRGMLVALLEATANSANGGQIAHLARECRKFRQAAPLRYRARVWESSDCGFTTSARGCALDAGCCRNRREVQADVPGLTIPSLRNAQRSWCVAGNRETRTPISTPSNGIPPEGSHSRSRSRRFAERDPGPHWCGARWSRFRGENPLAADIEVAAEEGCHDNKRHSP